MMFNPGINRAEWELSKPHLSVMHNGDCFEVYQTGGNRDGEIVGYAIRFTDRWHAYVRDGMGLNLRFITAAPTSERAVQRVFQHA